MIMIKFLLPIALLVILISGCQKTPESGEKLLAKPPNGWKIIYQINNIDTRLTDFIPAEDNEITWRTKISFESFKEFGTADPIEVTLDEVDEDKKQCSFVQHLNLFSGLENNYPTSIRLYSCGKHSITEKGEVKMLKAIRADEYFYVIRLVRRLDPFDANQTGMEKGEIAAWSNYMKKIIVCNENQENHPCTNYNPIQ